MIYQKIDDSAVFSALVVRELQKGIFTRNIEERRIGDLPDGDVLVEVHFSSLNYKDALSASGNRGVTKRFPHTPGIDAAGVVAASTTDDFREGDEVLVSGYDLGMNTPGGFGRFIRVPAGWVMRKPRNFSCHQCMQIGTAGFTAAQSVRMLWSMGVRADQGDVLVTGASGGVGSFAVALLSRSGYSVVAATGKKEEHSWLRNLGAVDFLDRQQAAQGSDKMLLRQRWAGVVDTVGGPILASAIKATQYDGTVTCCGNAASGDLPLNVYPFILRGVRLIGIDSASCPMHRRQDIWKTLAEDWDLGFLDSITNTILLTELNEFIEKMRKGKIRGRIVVDMRKDS